MKDGKEVFRKVFEHSSSTVLDMGWRGVITARFPNVCSHACRFTHPRLTPNNHSPVIAQRPITCPAMCPAAGVSFFSYMCFNQHVPPLKVAPRVQNLQSLLAIHLAQQSVALVTPWKIPTGDPRD